MRRWLTKALAMCLCASLVITGVPRIGFSANAASAANPYATAMAAHLSSIASLTPASLDKLRTLALGGPIDTVLSPERKAAQALLAVIASSPGVARLDHQPIVREILAQDFGKEYFVRAESIAKRFHSSSDPEVKGALVRIQNHFGADKGRILGLIHLQARLGEIFDGSAPKGIVAVADALPSTATEAPLSLSNQRKAVLAVATQGDYTVRVLRGAVAGKQRLVVLLGERHVKNEWNDKLGKRVISYFPVRGMEGFLDTGNIAYRLTCSVFIPIAFGLARLISRGTADQGSSLTEAFHFIDKERAGRQRFSEAVSAMAAPQRAKLLESLRQVPATLSGDPISPADYPGVTFEQAAQALEAAQAGLEPKLFLKGRRSVFPLEIGHKAGIAEQLELFAETAGLLAPIIMMPLALWLHSFPPLLTCILAVPILYFFYVQCGILMSALYGERPWMSSLLALAGPRKIVDRNKTMANNIIEIFQCYMAFNAFLAIMGQAHIPGIKKILVERFGFAEISLDEAGAP